MRNSERKLTTCYTWIECQSCQNITKRKFESSDFVFKNGGKCSECDGNLLITMIFGKTIE
ncbi:MAG: hypothetical protein VX209_03795 [Thermoproteota archaeon]|nr:hypothetical protein [Thermoproteota archaeon]